MTRAATRSAVQPQELYTQVWRLTLDSFFNSGALRNWNYWRHRFAGQIYTVQDAIDASNDMLASLNDKFARVRSALECAQREQEEVNLHSVVDARMLSSGIAHIAIRTFNVSFAADELAHVMAALPDHCRGIVLDLRGNAGGMLHGARRAASLFLDECCTMRSARRENDFVSEDTWFLDRGGFTLRTVTGRQVSSIEEDRLPNLSRDLPIAVLVNRDTASAAELFASILADNGRAILVGTETCGKGISQERKDLLFGATLDLTTGRFFSPHGHWFGDAGQTCAYGLRPHIVSGWMPLTTAERWFLEGDRFEPVA